MDLVVARQSACGCVDHRDCDRVVVPVDVGWLSFYELALVVWCCCLFELVADLLCLELRWSSFVVAWMSCVQFVCCMFITELIGTSPCADLYFPILFSLCLDDTEPSSSWCVWFGVGMIFVAICCCVSWLVVAAFLQVISRQNGFLPFVLLMLQRRRGSYCFRRASCSWFLLRGLWMLLVVVLGCRRCVARTGHSVLLGSRLARLCGPSWMFLSFLLHIVPDCSQSITFWCVSLLVCHVDCAQSFFLSVLDRGTDFF